jgi:uncharacterized protein with HEPN domain
MKRDETVYLQHILDAITRIEEYIGRMSEAEFYRQNLNQDGVIRQLEIIGEAVRHLDIEFRNHYPDVPWQDIARTRDKLIHDYFGVDIEKVWVMTKDDIPALRGQIEVILSRLQGKS